ncbi:MAG: YitT family protein [Lachnospiraceae bacterium]|nr:YitT family protein [Lachnospiraceae bacterium]
MKDHLIRRYSMFLCGVIISACGIAFVTRAGLGTSPVSGLPFVLSLITEPSMGVYTFIFNMIYLAMEAMIRRRFTFVEAIQILIAVFFSLCIDFFMAMIPTRYGGPWMSSLVYLLIGCAVMAFGISFEVMADVIMLPAEALVRAISNKYNRAFGNTKVLFDSTLTLIAVVIALISFHKLNGVREGTIFNALVVGQLVKLYTKLLQPMKRAWLGTEE